MIDIVQKLWGFCHTLRHDGVDYGDYIEQITYLLFLKMADERAIELHALSYKDSRGREIALDCSWPTLAAQSGTALLEHYANVLVCLGRQPGILGDIYAKSQNRFNNPVNLKKLIGLIDETHWISLDVDIKAHAYEGLLEKAASEGKKGAGQYFTPRVLIQSIVRCMKPDPRVRPDFAISDPACGTGGFIVAAYEWLMEATKGGAIERTIAKRIKKSVYHGQELVERPRRLALMNLYLHGIEPKIILGDTIYEAPAPDRFDVILTNPPFGTKGANQAPNREDFTVETSNKQLNFLQHILTILKSGGRAAVVLPDNCLFADQAGEVFKILCEDCDLHTVLRLPRGTFTPYSQGVKANVVFFTKGYRTENVWIYDARSNVPGITKKDRPLTAEYFAEFEKCFGPNPSGSSGSGVPPLKQSGRAVPALFQSGSGVPPLIQSRDGSATFKRKESHSPPDKGYLGGDRWRCFSLAEVQKRDFKLDSFKWLRDESLEDSDELPPPEELATDAISELETAVEELNAVLALLENGNGKVQAV